MGLEETGGTMKLTTDDPRIVALTGKLIDFVNEEKRKVNGTSMEQILITTIAVFHLYEAVKKENEANSIFVCLEDEEEEGEG